MKNIMLDLETMSLRSNALITSIGAVGFNPRTGQLGPKFKINIDVAAYKGYGPASFDLDPGTQEWWAGQSEEAIAGWRDNAGGSVRFAIESFADWVGDSFGRWAPDIQVWGNGAAFDNVIINNAFRETEIPKPWTHKGDQCYRTLKGLFSHIECEDYGTAHDSLDDAIAQAIHANAIFAGSGMSC